MDLLFNYLEEINRVNSVSDYSLKTIEFIDTHFNVPTLLLCHLPRPNTLKIVRGSTDKTLDYWNQKLSNISLEKSLQISDDQEYGYFFSKHPSAKETIYIFIVQKPFPGSLQFVLQSWQILNEISIKNQETIKYKTCNDYGNLISQLLHDVQSLMDLNNQNNIEEIKKKMAYQKRVNKNLLFYIRDFDLFKTEIEIEKLIKDSLSLMEINSLPKISIKADVKNITLDVELFSQALNAIVENAVHSTNKDLNKIEICVSKLQSNSPFYKNSWIVFDIIDEGKGIPEDFIPFVKNPFFTTDKFKGFSGFGLTNAEKIITAHSGYLTITSDENRTSVKMTLPEK